ncbi:MFS transporter [candidate division KSB1 bacterium]|nr:MFS transporter [candidate division KSB1 bacterium]
MFKNHPTGLRTLFFTEMWERFGFYIMIAVFVLYMDEHMLWDDSQKGTIYGLFLGAVYFIPIAGGWIADRLLGYAKTIKIGALVMAIGYMTLAFSSNERVPVFFLALALIAVGNGLFKANISVLVGNLYEKENELKDNAYNIFYMGINIGAAIAPLAATAFSLIFHDYRYTFGVASLGMIVSIFIFHLGRNTYRSADNTRASRLENIAPTADIDKREERQRLVSLGILFAIAIFFWMAFYQNGFALTLFAQRSTITLDYLRPETYQFFNPFFILVLTPVLVYLFSVMRRRGKEPSSPAKIAYGMFICALAWVIMAIASIKGGNQDMTIMSPAWLISTYFVITISELLVSPMGLSFVSKVAPKRMRGLMMGFWFGATAIGSYLSGFFGKYYSILEHHQYFIYLTAALILSGFLVVIFLKKLKRFSK